MNHHVKRIGKKILPNFVHRPGGYLYRKAVILYYNLFSRRVSLENLMLGGEGGIPANKYSRLTDDPGRPSTPLGESPHVKLLTQYESIGESVFEATTFEKTPYYQNAKTVIELFGHYFEAREISEIVAQARIFLDTYLSYGEHKQEWDSSMGLGHSQHGLPIFLRKIQYSDGMYQIVDGHHRAAAMLCRKEQFCSAYILNEPPVLTPLQQVILDGLSTKGARILYQPVDAPEFGSEWPRVRKCTDRFKKMSAWLEKNGIQSKGNTYIDLGSSYGWFVRAMQEKGCESFGTERDLMAIETGRIAYSLSPDRIFCQKLVQFLTNPSRTYDVVSCFSVLHHFAIGRSHISAEHFLKLIDEITGRVLFFDTGQNHEQWFKEELPDWDEDYIANWIKDNSSFAKIEKLGVDEDQVPPYHDNYGRMLFACTR